MMSLQAEDFRAAARKALSGSWPISIAVTWVASILGAFGFYNSSLTRYLLNFLFYGTPVTATDPALSAMQWSLFDTTLGISVISMLLYFTIGAALYIGLCRYNMALYFGENPSAFKTVFSSVRQCGKAIALRLFTSLFVFLWSLAFVIPGIVAAYRYAMAPYVLAQNPDMSIRDAVHHSKAMMKGKKGDLFALELSFIGWAFLALLTCGIGAIALSPYILCAKAAFYLHRTGQLPGSYFPVAQEPKPPIVYTRRPPSGTYFRY